MGSPGNSRTPLLAALHVGWLLTACTVEQPPAPVAPVAPVPTFRPGPARVDTWPVPADFPAMLGCANEEIAHPNPAVESASRTVCEAAQLGLYQLSQDTTLSEDEARTMAHTLMAVTLEKLAAVRADTGTSGGTDGGTSSGDGGMP